MKCVVCDREYPTGKKHKCSPQAIARFEKQLVLRDRKAEPPADLPPTYDEQLADGFALLGDE